MQAIVEHVGTCTCCTCVCVTGMYPVRKPIHGVFWARLGKPYKETVVGVPRFVPAVRGLQSNQNACGSNQLIRR